MQALKRIETSLRDAFDRHPHLLDALAITLIGVALLSTYGGVWRLGISEVVPARSDARMERVQRMREADQRTLIWSIARTARVLTTRPSRFYDVEACYPAAHPMGLGHSLTALGIVGIPTYLVTGDPVATYNMALFCMSALMALAMYWLVVEWTTSRAAGLTAALLFAFHDSITGQLTHPYINDVGWMVLALLFARRFFERARPRDALLAGVLCALQAISNPYSAYASILVGAPMVVWMLRRYGARRALVLPGLAAAACMSMLSLVALYPYVVLLATTEVLQRDLPAFTSWSVLLPRSEWLGTMGPGPNRFPGFVMIGLVIAALTSSQSRALAGLDRVEGKQSRRADPRWMLVLSVILLAGVVTGGNVVARFSALRDGAEPPMALPNLFEILATIIPGLDAVRVIGYLYPGIHLCLALLAGLGAAAALSHVRVRWRSAAGAALVLVTFGATVEPSWLGLGPSRPESSFVARPPADVLAFFEALDALGNEGPLLELPMGRAERSTLNSTDVLLSAYHHRHTSSCQPTFHTQDILDLQDLSQHIQRGTVRNELHRLGFTTILVHTRARTPVQLATLAKVEALAADPNSGVRALHSVPGIAAYTLEPNLNQ